MKFTTLALFLLAAAVGLAAPAAEKPRVFVLTDIENEPDDAMSMVRFLTYANHFEIEGLIATTSIHQRNKVAPQTIRKIVEAYGKVRDNLEKHEPGFPSGEQMLALVSEGLHAYGMQAVGAVCASGKGRGVRACGQGKRVGAGLQGVVPRGRTGRVEQRCAEIQGR
jgi:hypothetical protein